MATKAKPIIAISAPVTITAGEADGEKKGPAKFTSTFYTGGKLDLAGWDMPVVVDLAAMSEAKVLVANLDHDQTKRVGNFAVANDGKSLVANGTATAKTAARDEVVESALAGYQWQSSLEVNPKQITEVKAGKKVTVNGQEQEGPFYQVAGTLKGFGFVSHGADDSTTATIAAQAAFTKGKAMKAEIKAWAEGMGIDVENATPEAVATIEANYAGLNPEKPKKKIKLDEGVEAKQAEVERVETITEIALTACDKRPYDIKAIKEMAEQGINGKWTVEKFRLELLEASLPPAHTVFRTKRDERLTGRVLEAALCQAGRLGTVEDDFTDQELQAAHEQFKEGIGLNQFLILAAQANGYHGNTGGRMNLEIQRAAFGLTTPRHIHATGFSTIDVANIVGAVANKFLHEGWMFVDQTPMRIARIKNVRNFQTATTVSLTGALQYEKVGPAGEIKHGTLDELTYTNRAETYAAMLAITRQDMINDDLGALTAVPRRLGRGSALKLNDIFWTEFLGLVSASFFASGNSNINTAVADMTVGGLDATETIFMNQTDPDGKPVGFMPQIILVPTALKNKAQALMFPQGKLTSGASAPGTPDTNVFAGRFRVESSPYISNSSYTGNTSTAWWMLADPNDEAVIEIAALNGRVEPTVETADADFNVLGVQMRGYSDIGVNEQEYRAGVHADGGAS